MLWNLFTAIGAIAGNALGDPKQWGLDGAAVAAFLGLLWPRIKSWESGGIAVVCALATTLSAPLVPRSSGRRHGAGHRAVSEPQRIRADSLMTMWLWVLIACAIGYLTKLLGYLVPQKWMKNATMVNTVATGQQLVFDARLGALIAAAVALWLRAPFLVVVLVGALAAAGLRMLGWA